MRKVKFSYILLIISTFLFALLVGGPMPYLLFYITILTFLIPLLHLLISFIGLKASIKLPNSYLYTGSSIDIEYDIRNKNFFSIPILKFSSDISKKLGDKTTPSKTLSLSPREVFKYKEEILLKRRGFYENIDLKVNISDIYSFFTFKKIFHNKAELLIYPNVIQLDSFRTSSNKNLGELLVQDSMFQDKTSISSIKEYTEGDSIKQIHWKVSAKRGLPMIKSFEKVSNANLNIFMDSHKALFIKDLDRRLEDKIVDTSLAIVNYFLKLDVDLSLNTLSKDKQIELSDRNNDDIKSFLKVFARFKGDGDHPIGALVQEKMHSFVANSIIMIVTPNLDKEIGGMGIKLKMKNLIPIFIIITDKENDNISIDKDVEKRLTEENIELYFIDYGSNIKEELEIKHG